MPSCASADHASAGSRDRGPANPALGKSALGAATGIDHRVDPHGGTARTGIASQSSHPRCGQRPTTASQSAFAPAFVSVPRDFR